MIGIHERTEVGEAGLQVWEREHAEPGEEEAGTDVGLEQETEVGEALERKKTAARKDFGELVRERRRQRGLPLPIADRVLPFRLSAGHAPAAAGEGRVAEAWGAVQAAEQAGRSRRVLRELEEAYLAEVAALSMTIPPAFSARPERG